MTHHFIEIDGTCGRMELVCTAPAGAACRMVWDCDCDEWHSETCDSEARKLVDMGECNHALFINNDDIQWLGTGAVSIPVATSWGGEGYVWSFEVTGDDQ